MLICAVSWLNWNPLVKWQHKDLALIKEKRTEKGSTDSYLFKLPVVRMSSWGMAGEKISCHSLLEIPV